ncbi:MAG: cation:proton antiporter [Lactobacillaceae bacterium]|jgi:Kef-type K+ transport system membrane component KefB|nr:cation:proton antiporter [Lactobacillaceae bacterium]
MHFESLILILLATTLLGWGAQKLNLPVVAGQLLAGLILGPALLNLVHTDSIITFVADLGVMILMFLAGMETDIKLLRANLLHGFSVAIFGALVPFLSFWAIGGFLGMNNEESIFLGIVFAATSVSISAEVLTEYNQLKTKAGSTILGAAVVDDILAVILLSVFVAIFGQGGSSHSDKSVPVLLVLAIAFFAVMYLYTRYIVPLLFKFVNAVNLNGIIAIVSMFVVLLGSYYAEISGLSEIVGAFFVGLAVSTQKQVHEVIDEFTPVGYALFIPVFFASIGLNIRLDSVDWIMVILLTILAFATKYVGSFFGDKILGASAKDANIVGLGMVSRGEMALIFAGIGLGSKLISESNYSMISVVVILTTIIAPIALKKAF